MMFRRIFYCLLAMLFGMLQPAEPIRETALLHYTHVRLTANDSHEEKEPYLRAVWLSQFDLHPILRDGGKQRDEEEFRRIAKTLCDTLCLDGFNTVFLQLRPNGDSLYESALFPLSKYVAGVYGGTVDYDAIAILIEEARKHGLSVHGWINPLRLVLPEEMKSIPQGFAVRDWYDAGSGQVKEVNGRLYLDPSYPEVRALIADGAREILTRYAPDGIHMDDYFYPTTDPSFDREEFASSGAETLTDFRIENINALVRLLYKTVHSFGSDKQFGIAPAGNLDSLAVGYYADAREWCSHPGYIDYILPQIYFGFENACCPFDRTVLQWEEAVTEGSVSLYIGLDAAKAYYGTLGETDTFAGSEEGKTEWIRNKDILARSLQFLYTQEKVSGYCFFSYAYLYDRFDGSVVPEISEEYQRFSPLLTKR